MKFIRPSRCTLHEVREARANRRARMIVVAIPCRIPFTMSDGQIVKFRAVRTVLKKVA